MKADNAVSPEFKFVGSKVYYVPMAKDELAMPDFGKLRATYEKVSNFIAAKKVFAASSVRIGGMAAAITKMCLGNGIGFKFAGKPDMQELFKADYGALILEVAADSDIEKALAGTGCYELGITTQNSSIVIGDAVVSFNDAKKAYTSPLEKIFPTSVKTSDKGASEYLYTGGNRVKPQVGFAKPKIFIPVFPGTNCEYDTARAFRRLWLSAT